MSKTWESQTDMPDLEGKIVMVAGANSDIGAAMIGRLSLHRAKVYATTRSEAKARETQRKLVSRYPNIDLETIIWLQLDITDLNSITNLAEEFKKREGKLHILINNVAAATSSAKLAGHEWECHMATNYVGPFVLVNRLLPFLKNGIADAGADVRIISLSSVAHDSMLPANFKYNFDSPTTFKSPITQYPWQWRYFGRLLFGFDIIRYAVSKTANVMFTQELQRQLDKANIPITSIAVHPGEVATEGVNNGNTWPIRLVAYLTFISPDQGAISPLFAATAKEVQQSPEKYKGKFLMPVGRITAPNVIVNNEVQVRGLWDNTIEEVNKHLGNDGLPLLGPWV